MFNFSTKLLFIIGVATGIFLAVIFEQNSRTKLVQKVKFVNEPFKNASLYNIWFNSTKLHRRAVLWDDLRYSRKTFYEESKYLFDKVKVMCIILVRKPNNLIGANDTWIKGCNDVKFVKLYEKRRKIPVVKSREITSWVVLCEALKHVPDTYYWYLIVNDYTFVILENLRLFVSFLNPSIKYYLGHTVQFWGIDYNMGQAGYVLSRGSILAFKDNFYTHGACHKDFTYMNREDYYLGKHLKSLNITTLDTRDSFGYSTFHPYNFYQLFFPQEHHFKYSVYPHKCCSKNSISFQAIDGDKMYFYYYILYQLQIFYDGYQGNAPAPKSLPDEEVWQQFLRERNITTTNVTSQQYYKAWEDLISDPESFAKNMKREQNFDYD